MIPHWESFVQWMSIALPLVMYFALTSGLGIYVQITILDHMEHSWNTVK